MYSTYKNKKTLNPFQSVNRVKFISQMEKVLEKSFEPYLYILGEVN